MSYRNFEALIARSQNIAPKTLVVAAAHDAHTLEAVQAATKTLPLRSLLVGDRDRILRIAGEIGFSIDESQIIDSGSDDDCARQAVSRVRDGEGDFLMKGILQTATLLKAVLDKESGIRGESLMSHVSVLESPAYHKLFVLTDVGMNTHPNLEQKATIAKNAIAFWHSLGVEQPKVAFLAAVETVSDKMPETIDAQALARMAAEGALGACVAEGPISLDLAISPETAATKGYASAISGETDIFVVPEITAGNVLTKGLVFLGGAKMAGCVVGAKAPIVLTSRGATAEEKLFSILICANAV